MWTQSVYGHFSIVKKGQPGEWQIRARIKADLEGLISAVERETIPYGKLPDIIESHNTDYRYRIIVNSPQLAAVFMTLMASIDYSNFKSEIGRIPSQKNKLHAYHDIWAIMERFQSRRRDRDDLAVDPRGDDKYWSLIDRQVRNQTAPQANHGGKTGKKKKPSGAFWRRLRKERQQDQVVANMTDADRERIEREMFAEAQYEKSRQEVFDSNPTGMQIAEGAD